MRVAFCDRFADRSVADCKPMTASRRAPFSTQPLFLKQVGASQLLPDSLGHRRCLPEAEKAPLSRPPDTAWCDGEDESACNTYVELANPLPDHFDVPRALTADSPGSRTGKQNAE